MFQRATLSWLRAALCAAAVLLSPLVRAQAGDPFAGTFSAPELLLTLRRDGAGYTGEAQAEGMTLPVSAQPGGSGQLRGSFHLAQSNVPFQAQLAGDQLRLTVNGSTYLLTRPAPAPALAAAPGGSQLQPGETGDPERGVAFRLPPGLLAQPVERGFVITGGAPDAAVLVLYHPLGSLAELKASARQGHVEPGVELRLQGEPSAFQSNGLSATLAGVSGGLPARARVVSLVSPFGGGGVTVLVAAQASQLAPELVKLAESLAGSVRFFRPAEPASTPLTREWQQRLSGARLTHLSRYGGGLGADGSYAGGTQETRIDLCAQGHFKLASSSSAVVSAGSVSGSSGGASRGDGTWEVSAQGGAARLRLRFADGRTAQYRLSQVEGKVHLDGNRYFLTRAGDGEHAPRCP